MASEHTVYITEILMYHNIRQIFKKKSCPGGEKKGL